MHYKFLTPIWLVISATIGCAPAPTYTPTTYSPPPRAPEPPKEKGTPVTLTAKQQQAVRLGAAKGMKDPESARFEDKMAAVKNADGIITVCGYVNGKNSYGGYVGMSPFIGVLDKGPNPVFTLVDIGSQAKYRHITIKMCRDEGIEGIS